MSEPLDKRRFPIAECRKIAEEICGHIAPVSERIVVAGSMRRNKPFCSDVEILYISKTEVRQDPLDMFARITVNLADEAIAALEKSGVLERRRNVNGSEMYGPKNKLMLHRASGIPVDFFASTPENWWNYLVCRTGPADSNTRICMAAQDRGWKWSPYSAGFKDRHGEIIAVTSEREVFELVGLKYNEPEARR